MVKDIIIDDNNDLLIESGDFFVNDSDQQHVLLILNTYSGNWKQFPLIGVGIKIYLASSGQQNTLKRDMTVQMNSDGYQINEIILKDNSIYYIDAKRLE